MHVSKDGGDSWDPVQVPSVTPERVTSCHLIFNFETTVCCVNGIGSNFATGLN